MLSNTRNFSAVSAGLLNYTCPAKASDWIRTGSSHWCHVQTGVPESRSNLADICTFIKYGNLDRHCPPRLLNDAELA